MFGFLISYFRVDAILRRRGVRLVPDRLRGPLPGRVVAGIADKVESRFVRDQSFVQTATAPFDIILLIVTFSSI